MRRLVRPASLAALLLAAATPLMAQTASTLPAGDGRDLVAAACSQCHSLAPLTAVRDGPAGWKRHVYNMVLRGAQLTPREADTVIRISSRISAPASRPAAKPVTLPAGPTELVESRCAVCHDPSG
jgi:cytochrome c5